MKFACIALLGSVILFSCSPKLSPDQNWAEGKWVLTELKEVPVQISGNIEKNAHIVFLPSSKSYQGFGGCNGINGSYTIGKTSIRFTSLAARLAGCPDVPFETTFLSLLKEVNKYSIDGNILSLKKGNKIEMKLQRK
jgi:heat shock protein HslJ